MNKNTPKIRADFSDSVVAGLALPCAMGDVFAMAEMSRRHGALVKKRQLVLPKNNDPSFYEENEEDVFHLYGEAFWYWRARAYCLPGQLQALTALREKPRSAVELFPETQTIHQPGPGRYLPYGRERLKQLGIDPVSAGGLYGLNEYGYFVSEGYSGYEGNDETGFGMENEYNYTILDDFFMPVRTLMGWSHLDFRNNEKRIWRECGEQRKKNQQVRDQYWKKHDTNRRGKVCLVP